MKISKYDVTNITVENINNVNYILTQSSKHSPKLTASIYVGDSTQSEIIIEDSIEDRLVDYVVCSSNKKYINVAYTDRIQKIKLGKYTTGVGSYAFTNCRNLHTIDLGTSLETFGKNTFSGCKSLTKVNLPESMRVIGTGAFSKCKNLQEINLPDNITDIHQAAFAFCSKLTHIILPESLKTISNKVFFKTGLEKIVIPKSVTRIGDSSFFGSNLREIEIHSKNITLSPKSFDGIENLTISLHGVSKKDFLSKADNEEYLQDVQITWKENGVEQFSWDNINTK